MKKISLFIGAAILSTAVIAQQKPVFGLKAGLNVANIKEQNVTNAFDTRLGFHVGGLAHFHVTNQIAFQPEIQFSSQGAELKNSNDELQLSYVNVPLMFQYMFNNGFRIEAGPQIGFLVNAEREIGGNDIDSDDEFKKADVALGIGLNYLTYSGFGVGGRYNFGVSNAREQGTNDYTNRVFQASVFYMFDNDHKAKSR